MTLLIVLSHAPYDGTDVAWNALRLAATVRARNLGVRLFLINDGVDAARSAPPEVEFNLGEMLTELAEQGADVLLCGTCMTRCGIGAGDVVPGTRAGSMDDLVSWIENSDRVVSF